MDAVALGRQFLTLQLQPHQYTLRILLAPHQGLAADEVLVLALQGHAKADTRLEGIGLVIELIAGEDQSRLDAQYVQSLKTQWQETVGLAGRPDRIPQLGRVLGVAVGPAEVVTSALAAVSVLGPNVRRCLVVGGPGLIEAVEGSGRVCVTSGADAVVVGLDRSFDYVKLTRAADEIRRGADFVASNTDPTFPVADGLKPGGGSIVSAIATASGVDPVVAGKPNPPIRSLIRALGVGPAWVVGDRIDTDIRLASHESDWTSILVLSGVTHPGDDVSEADHVVPDLVSAADLVLATVDAS